MRIRFTLLLLSCFGASMLLAQAVSIPPSGDNQKSVVTQYLGKLAHVTITYNSPDVHGPNGEDRSGQIWGRVVPYGLNNLGFGTSEAAPWRAGANENTTFTFSHDMEVEGQSIPAGTYGFHVIPRESGPWTLIFSRNATAWGSYFYDPADDVLRVDATPEESPYHEWLTYAFTDRRPDRTTVALRWDQLALPFTITLPDANELYVAQLGRELEGEAGFSWQNWITAASYLLQENIHLETALSWSQVATSRPFVGQENFTTLNTQAQVLERMGRAQEAEAVMARAIALPTASAMEIHQYGRQLIAAGKGEKAMEVFKMNHQRFDGAWPTNFGLARAYAALGDFKKALQHAKKARELAPDQANRDYLVGLLTKLEAGEDIN